MFVISTPAHHRGMTLIELLVVLTIMALLTAVTAVSTGMVTAGETRTRAQAARVADDLVRQFKHVGLSAQLRGEALAWSPEPNGWQHWASTGPGARADWQPWRDAPPGTEIPDDLRLELVRETQPASPSANVMAARVLFLPAQGIVPFELLVRERSSGNPLARVWLAEDARLLWEEI